MALVKKSKVRDVRGISNAEKAAIKAFMQGAIYCWVKNRKEEWFAVRDLMGGLNRNWTGTPLSVLYEKHRKKGNKAANKSAGKDLGWLVKAVLDEDSRTFKARRGFVNIYRWVDSES